MISILKVVYFETRAFTVSCSINY